MNFLHDRNGSEEKLCTVESLKNVQRTIASAPRDYSSVRILSGNLNDTDSFLYTNGVHFREIPLYQ